MGQHLRLFRVWLAIASIGLKVNSADLRSAEFLEGAYIMYKFQYSLYYAMTYATLHFVDAWVNYRIAFTLYKDDFRPSSTPDSFLVSVFEPLNVMILCVCTLMLFMMEQNSKRTAALLRADWGALLGTPYVLLALKLLSMLNSGLVSVGMASPVSYFYVFEKDDVLSLIFFCTAVAIVLSFPVTNYLRKRYPIA